MLGSLRFVRRIPTAARMARSLSSISTIDCNYGTLRHTAAFLVREGNHAAFVENNTSYAVPSLLAELDKHPELKPDDVQYIIITHAHLDHAGGTGQLAQACKNATIIAHPRAAPHMIDPSRLIKGVKGVYGEERYKELYGEIVPVPRERVRAMEDGEEIPFGDNGRRFKFIHTRGHAKHHMVVHDLGANAVFTGDAFGVSYFDIFNDTRTRPARQSGEHCFLFPSTSPVDFEPAEALSTLEKLKTTGATDFFLTHFGRWPLPLQDGVDQMARGIVRHEEIMKDVKQRMQRGEKQGPDLMAWCEAQVTAWFKSELDARGLDGAALCEGVCKLDIELNAQGLIAAAAFQQQQAASKL